MEKTAPLTTMAGSADSFATENTEESEESSEEGGKEAGERGESNSVQFNLDSNPDDVLFLHEISAL